MMFCHSQSYGHIFKSSTRVAVNRMLQQTCQGVRGVWLQGREQDPFLRPLNLANLKKNIQEDNRLCELGEDGNESHFHPHYDELRPPALGETSAQHADISGGYGMIAE